MDYLRALGYSSLSIELLDKCNLHCVYCPYDDGTYAFDQMQKPKAFEIVDQLAEDNALDGYLLFNILGEPLMYKGLFDFIKYANQKGLKTKLVTNGSLLTKDNIDGLIDANPSQIKISVESMNPQIFGDFRGTTIPFEKYMERVTNMLSSALNAPPPFNTEIHCDVLFNTNNPWKRRLGLENEDPGQVGVYTQKQDLLDDLKRFLDPMVERGDLAEIIAEDPRFDMNNWYDNGRPLFALSDKIGFYVKIYHRWRDVFNRKYPVESNEHGCHVENLAIHANGDVALCCVDYNASTAIGNVYKRDLRDILMDDQNVEIIQNLRQGRFHFDGCKSCMGHTTLLGKVLTPHLDKLGQIKRKLVGAK